ncbi:MAG: TauD/TfdA family dioxygenase [Vulcanimicrobiaceae bacterium]
MQMTVARSILTGPIEGPVVWNRSDLERDDSWKMVLSGQDLEEVNVALQSVKRQNIAMGDLRRADFPLPTLGGKLTRVVEELERGRGLKLIRGLPVDRYSEEELALVYWGIGTHLGTAVSQNPKGDILGNVRDQGVTLSNLSARGYQTRESQGLHIDNCDVVGLLCLKTAQSGGISQVVSSMSIYNELLRRYPWYVGVLYEPFAIDMRGQERPGDPPVWYRTVYSYYDGKLSCGVNFTYMRSAPAKTGVPLSPIRQDALAAMEEIAYEQVFEMDFAPGDMQFLNNYVILHDRTPYVDWDEPEKKRHLLRLWLSIPGSRKLAPDFRSAYGETLKGYEDDPRDKA